MEAQTIVLIEDDPDIRRVAEIALQFRGGFTVHGAESGEEGIRLAREQEPDLILLDVMMPGMDGYETCRLLKADPATRKIPVIFLSARSKEDARKRVEELGAVGFLTKPFDPLALADRIQEILAPL